MSECERERVTVRRVGNQEPVSFCLCSSPSPLSSHPALTALTHVPLASKLANIDCMWHANSQARQNISVLTDFPREKPACEFHESRRPDLSNLFRRMLTASSTPMGYSCRWMVFRKEKRKKA